MPFPLVSSKAILTCLCAGLAAGSVACSDTDPGGVGGPYPPPASAQWRWMAPVSQGISLTDIWGPAADNLFATGSKGVVLRYNGATWRRTTTPTTEPLNALWGTSGSNLIAVGGDAFTVAGIVLRFDGTAWTKVTDTDHFLLDVWGANANDVFAVGGKRTILHYDGASWSPMTVPPGDQGLSCVWGSGSSNVYVAGIGTGLLHYDGVAWSEIATPAASPLDAVWGTSASDVFAVGNNGTAIHFDGVDWTPIDVGVALYFKDLWGPSGTDVYAVGQAGNSYRWNGSTWTPLLNGSVQELEAVFGVDGRVFAAGRFGTILELSGDEWIHAPGAVTVKLEDVWMDAAGDAFAVGNYGTILRLLNGAWEPMESGTTFDLLSIHGVSSSNLIAVGRKGIVLRFDGVAWTSSIEGPGLDLHDVWMLADGEAYAAGAGGTVLHSLGVGWADRSIAVTDSLLSVWGLASDDVRVVGAESRAFTWNGLQWKLVTIDNARVNNYHSIFGTSSSDVYVGAEFLRSSTIAAASPTPLHKGGLVYHWNGSMWEIPYQDPIHDVLAVWAASPGRAFASGDASSILTGMDGTWTRLSSLPDLPFLVTSVWGTSANNVLVVGDNGTIVRYSR